MATERIEILLSRGKITLALIASLAFVAVGLWFVISPPQINSALFGNPVLIFCAGIASIGVFGVFSVVAVKKLADKKPGLIIDETGITDNASGASAGHIPWSDITEIKTIQVFDQKFVMIAVADPNKYIERQTNALRRKAMQMNLKSNGSPINISANALRCNFDTLKTTLQTEFDRNRG